MQNHAKCGQASTSYAPTRLIDVGNEQRHPRLHITNGKAAPQGYLTLSHCWGRPDPNAKKLELTLETLTSLQEGVALDDFPKTFHDAVITTRELGYQYIWIDSLCIIQRDQDDWAKEAAQMCSVYQNSVLTIAADQAPNSNHGFLGNLVDMGKSVHFMKFSNAQGQEDMLFARNVHFTPTLETLGCYKEEQTSHLDSRAWTFQERLLSPRILHFGAIELTWECNECMLCKCEIGASGSRFKNKFVEFIQDSPSLEHRTKLWTELAQQFSARNITFATDRLPAIGGLADAMNRSTTDEYLAGLWKGSLDRTLLWRVGAQAQRHEKYYAPTWSWASVTGPVTFVGQTATLLWSIVDATCTPAGPNQFGPVTQGAVTVRGPVATVTIQRETFLNKRENTEQVRHLVVSTAHPTLRKLVEKALPDIGPDGVDLDAQDDGDLSILFAAVEGSPGGWAMGLLLRRVKMQREGGYVFERVGMVICERQQWRNWEVVTKVETVTIV